MPNLVNALEVVRIAQVGPAPDGPGGMPAVIASLLVSPLAERYAMEAIPTYRDGRPLPRLLLFARALLRLARFCLGRGPRIVHVHMAARGSMYRKALVVAVAKACRRPVVLQIHAGPGDLVEFLERLDGIRRRLLAATFAISDEVISVSADGAAVLNRMVTDVPIGVVPNAPPPVAANGTRPAGAAKVVYVGGFADPAKGGAVLVAALPELFAARPGAEVALAGPGEAPAGLPDGATWLGWLQPPERDALLAEAGVFVLPSLSEGMPIALLEAMASGLPVVATKVGAVPDLLDDGVDGLLVEPGDPAALASALAGVVGDAERRVALGAAARARAERLASEDVYGRLEQIYSKVLG